VAVQPWVTEPF